MSLVCRKARVRANSESTGFGQFEGYLDYVKASLEGTLRLPFNERRILDDLLKFVSPLYKPETSNYPAK